MIKIGDKEYRNLEEQVLKNKEDIANHYNMDRVLADFGIRIIGTLPSESYLPYPYDGNYGDAFAVGDAAPYDFYIWTRADANAGHPEDYWFYLGSLAIVGPKGERGETGPKGEDGERGSIWISAPRNPLDTEGYLPGDQWLNTISGFIYTLQMGKGYYAWSNTGSIRGPQGIQGPRGETGLQGETGATGERGPRGEGAAIVTLVGIITSVDQLPNPETTINTNAYLQEVSGTWHLWVIVGTPGSYQWLDTGGLTAGTLITNNGSPVLNWDIKNVLDGPYTGSPVGMGDIPRDGVISQLCTDGINPYYYARVPRTALDTPLPGAGAIAELDYFGKIGAIAANKVPYYNEHKEVPKTQNPSDISIPYLPDNYATPRAYVDAQIQFAGQERVPYPSSIPNAGMLLAVNPDKSTEAIDAATLVGESIGVECWIVQRGESRVLPRDRVYLIRGYGDNAVKLIDRMTGNTIVDKCTMAIGMVSSSFWPHSPADNKAWAGFLYQTGSYSLSWNGDIRGEVVVENINTGTSGSGFLYVYTLGAKTNV